MCFNLIDSLLALNPASRLTVEQALRHPYWSEDPVASDKSSIPFLHGDWHEFESKIRRKEDKKAGKPPSPSSISSYSAVNSKAEKSQSATSLSPFIKESSKTSLSVEKSLELLKKGSEKPMDTPTHTQDSKKRRRTSLERSRSPSRSRPLDYVRQPSPQQQDFGKPASAYESYDRSGQHHRMDLTFGEEKKIIESDDVEWKEFE
jgi:serine/threonine protein kinase